MHSKLLQLLIHLLQFLYLIPLSLGYLFMICLGTQIYSNPERTPQMDSRQKRWTSQGAGKAYRYQDFGAQYERRIRLDHNYGP